jgi:hypothetical protein
MKPIDITGTVRDTFSIGIGKNKSEFGVFYGSLYFRNFEDNSWKKIASLQDISSSTKDFSWKSTTLYSVNSLVEYSGVFYKCITEHQSGISFTTDLLDVESKWQEIGLYGNLKLIDIETRTAEDFFYNLSKYDDTIIIYGNNIDVANISFKVYLPIKSKVDTNKIFNIQNASYNKVDIVYYNGTNFANNAYGDYVAKIQLINKNLTDNNVGKWNITFSDNRPVSKVSEWHPLETYRINDLVRVGYFLYTCITNHIANSSNVNGFNIDYEGNKWIYSGGAYAGGTYTLSDRMPINLKATGSREIYQLDMLGIPYTGNAPNSVLDLKNRRVMSNAAPSNTPRANTYTVAALYGSLAVNSNFKNKSTNEILRYIYKNYKFYQEPSYTSAIKLENGVPGKKYVLLIKSDGGPYLFDNSIIFSSYGNSSTLAPSGVTNTTGNWFSTILEIDAKKSLTNGITINNGNYPVDGMDSGLTKDTYRGNIFPVQSDPGKIDVFEFVCLDYSDQVLRPGSTDLFLGKYVASYNMGDNFPLRLTPFQPVVGGPGQVDPDGDNSLYVQQSISNLTLNGQDQIYCDVGQVLNNLVIIATTIRGSNDIVSIRYSYTGAVLADLAANPLGGEEVFTTINPFTLDAPGTIKIKASLSDGKSLFIKEANINFLYRFYWGFNANQTLTNAEILALEHSNIRLALHNELFVFQNNNNSTSEYIYFCYPSFYNDIAYIEDPIAGLSYSNDNLEMVTTEVTNEFGSNALYKIYRTKIKTYSSSFTWRINLT